jgi:hypothetical protein
MSTFGVIGVPNPAMFPMFFRAVWSGSRKWMEVGLFLSKWMEGMEEEGGNANDSAKCLVGNGGV